MKFEDLGLSPETLRAVEERGYKSPTDIQAKAIPAIQMTREVVGLCLLYTSPSPRDKRQSRMPSSA